jgi:deazaflavin-dependent oxidoreductase (nitroreductase family)
MSDESVRMPGTPPHWVNALVRTMLRTPGLRRLVGKGFGEITVTGARTGRRYSTPVQFMQVDGAYVVLSQRMRTWWRNIERRPEVDLLVGGTTVPCHGTIADGDRAHDLLTRCLEANPRVARFYGIPPGSVPSRAVDQLLDRVVVIVLEPLDGDGGR